MTVTAKSNEFNITTMTLLSSVRVSGQPSIKEIMTLLSSVRVSGQPSIKEIMTLLSSVRVKWTTLYQGNNDMNHMYWNVVLAERCILIIHDASGILLHVNEKFTMGKFQSCLVLSFDLNRTPVSISVCKYRYESPLVVSLVYSLFKLH